MVLVRKAECDESLSLHALCAQHKHLLSLWGGEGATLGCTHTGAVAQDNKVACCHSVARCEPGNPPVTHTLKSCNLLACARETARLYIGVQHGAKDLRLCLLSTNTARTRQGRVGKKTQKKLPSLSLYPSTTSLKLAEG